MTSPNVGYRQNHYVPIWYQRRFMLPDQKRYFRLDLKPEVKISGKVKYTRRDLHQWSPDKIFAENDLYTTSWGTIGNTEIEQFFFSFIRAVVSQAPNSHSLADMVRVSNPELHSLALDRHHLLDAASLQHANLPDKHNKLKRPRVKNPGPFFSRVVGDTRCFFTLGIQLSCWRLRATT